MSLFVRSSCCGRFSIKELVLAPCSVLLFLFTQQLVPDVDLVLCSRPDLVPDLDTVLGSRPDLVP